MDGIIVFVIVMAAVLFIGHRYYRQYNGLRECASGCSCDGKKGQAQCESARIPDIESSQ